MKATPCLPLGQSQIYGLLVIALGGIPPLVLVSKPSHVSIAPVDEQ